MQSAYQPPWVRVKARAPGHSIVPKIAGCGAMQEEDGRPSRSICCSCPDFSTPARQKKWIIAELQPSALCGLSSLPESSCLGMDSQSSRDGGRGLETSKLSIGHGIALAGWLSPMSKALPKSGSACARGQVSNTRPVRCHRHSHDNGDGNGITPRI